MRFQKLIFEKQQSYPYFIWPKFDIFVEVTQILKSQYNDEMYPEFNK